MSYAEAKADRKRKRRNERLGLIMGLLQGVMSSIGQGRQIRARQQFELDKESRAAEREIARDKARDEAQAARDRAREEADRIRDEQNYQRHKELGEESGRRQRQRESERMGHEERLSEAAARRRELQEDREEEARVRRERTDAQRKYLEERRKAQDEARRDAERHKYRMEELDVSGQTARDVARLQKEGGAGPMLSMTEAKAAQVIAKWGSVENAQAEVARLRELSDETADEGNESEKADELERLIETHMASEYRRAGRGGQADPTRAILNSAVPGKQQARGTTPTGDMTPHPGMTQGAPGTKGAPMTAAQASQSQFHYSRLADAYRRFMAGDQTAYPILQEISGGALPQLRNQMMQPPGARTNFSGMGTNRAAGPGMGGPESYGPPMSAGPYGPLMDEAPTPDRANVFGSPLNDPAWASFLQGQGGVGPSLPVGSPMAPGAPGAYPSPLDDPEWRRFLARYREDRGY